MASITKRNNRYCVVYYYKDVQGVSHQKWETFEKLADAKKRKSIIEAENTKGTFVAPNTDTVENFLETFIELYGYQKWSVNTLAKNRSIIKYYILPFIGNKKIQEIKPIIIEKYYHDLQNSRSVLPLKNNKDGRVTTSVLRDVHKLLRCAFGCAERWELIASNPFTKVTPPKHEYAKRQIWTAEEISKALEVCEDPKVSIAIQLSFACSLRLGEVLGLQWKNVFISDEDIENDNAHIVIDQQLQRLRKKEIEDLKIRDDIIFKFPPVTGNENLLTVMALRKPKTKSSIRTVWLPNTLVYLLRKWKEQQEQYKEFFQSEYHDYDLVISFEDGRPVAHELIRAGMNKLADKAELPHVVFHSLRHSSTTYKLKLNHGDIKATQGDTGHAQADMVTELYSHILDEDRKINAQKFDDLFYQNNNEEKVKRKKNNIDVDKLVDSIKENPDLMEKLLEVLK